MKITFNIQKKHLTIFMVFVLIIISGITIANQLAWTGQPSHDTLWTSEIRSKNSPSAIILHDDLTLEQGITLGGVKRTSWPTAGGGAGIDCVALPGGITGPSGYPYSKKRVTQLNPTLNYNKCLIGKCDPGISTPCADLIISSWISTSITQCDDGCRVPTSDEFVTCPIQCGSSSCHIDKIQSIVMDNSWVLYCNA